MSNLIVNTGTFPRLLTEGLYGLWGLNYKKYPVEWTSVFERKSSNKNFEDLQGAYGLGMAPQKSEADAVLYDAGGQGFSKRFTHVTYGIGVQISEEAIEDNKYISLSSQNTKDIMKALMETQENLAANVLNRATTSGYTGADGLTLASTAHLYMGGGTYSNMITNAAALSQTSLEDQFIAIDQMKDERQILRNISAKTLVIPPQLRFDAKRILGSDLQSDTADNAVNALKNMVNVVVMRRLTSSTAHFLVTDVDNGLMFFERVAPSFKADVDFDTGNIKLKGRMRSSVGWVDPHCVHYNAGL